MLSYGGDSANGHNFDGSLASFSAPQSLPENDVMRIDVSSHGTPKAQFGKVACLQSFLGGSFRALLGQVSEDVNVNT